MTHARQPGYLFAAQAWLPQVLGLLALTGGVAAAQAPPPQETQQPAPIVRVAPRSQTSAPAAVPPEAAPLAVRPARRKPTALQLGSATRSASPATTSPKVVQTAPANSSGNTTSAASAATGTAAIAPAAPKAPGSTTLNRTVIVLDPAHGGSDSGSRIGDTLTEKDVTLALAFRLRSLLVARGFTVVLTRENEAALTGTAQATPLTLDDRAGTANHARAAACLLLHATGRGTGVHLYGSDLDPAPAEATLLPWLTAQAAWVPASRQLQRGLSAALERSHIPLVASTASVRPVDSLTCPALVVELAPETEDARSVNDAGYQERVAAAIAGALVVWENQVQTPPKLPAGPTRTATHHSASQADTTAHEVQP